MDHHNEATEQEQANPTDLRRDSGFSIVEIVVAIVLMGTVGIAVMSSVWTGVKASSQARTAAQVETAVVNAVDRIVRAPKRCDYTIYAQAAVQTEEWPPSSASVIQQYYVPGPDATINGQWVTGSATTPACDGPATTDLLVQRVIIRITSPDGKISREIEVVKSDV